MTRPVDMEFYELLGVSPPPILESAVSHAAAKAHEMQILGFQSAIAESFKTKALLVHTNRDDGGNEEQFERLQISFFSLFVGVLRDAYDKEGQEGIAKVEGNEAGVFAWMNRKTNGKESDDADEDLSRMEIDVDEDNVAPVVDENFAGVIEKTRMKEKKHYDAWVDSIGAQSVLREIAVSVKEANGRKKKKHS